MSYSSNIIRNSKTVEYSKFVEIQDDSRFPAISVTRIGYYDDSAAFPANTGSPTYSAVDIYPKYAVLSYITNPEDISVSLSAGQVNVELEDIENLLTTNNALTLLQSFQLSGISAYVDDLEKNTFDTASACDDIYYEVKRLNTQTEILTTNSYFGTLSTKPLYVTSSPNAPSYVVFNDGPQLDAFGRLRVSEPFSLFDSKVLHDLGSLTFNNVTNGTGDVVFGSGDASVILSTNTAGSYAIRQTFTRFPYQPGKSQYALFTGVMEPQIDIVKRYGLFASLTAAPYSPNVGLYFEASDNTVSVWINNINNGASITPSQSAARANWNIDRMDGTGPSKVNLLFDKAQIFLIDYEWLGVGRVRFGFVVDGKIYYCHEFRNANNISAPYMFTPNLPVRAEIRQLGATPGTFRVICQSVMSEGGHNMVGVTHSIYTSAAGLNINTAGDRRAILGLRTQSNKLDSVTQILNAYVGVNPGGSSTVAHFRWELVLNPTIGGTTPIWNNVTDSNLQAFIASDNTNTVAGGTVLLAGISNVGAPIDISTSNFQQFKKLGCSIDGKRDELYLVVTPLVNPSNNGVWGSLTYVDSD